MQPHFMVGKLVLKAEGLVSTIRYLGFLFQTTPTGVVAKLNQVAFAISHLARDADLVAVEIVGLLAAFASEGVAFAVAVLSVSVDAVEIVRKTETACVRTAHTLRHD